MRLKKIKKKSKKGLRVVALTSNRIKMDNETTLTLTNKFIYPNNTNSSFANIFEEINLENDKYEIGLKSLIYTDINILLFSIELYGYSRYRKITIFNNISTNIKLQFEICEKIIKSNAIDMNLNEKIETINKLLESCYKLFDDEFKKYNINESNDASYFVEYIAILRYFKSLINKNKQLSNSFLNKILIKYSELNEKFLKVFNDLFNKKKGNIFSQQYILIKKIDFFIPRNMDFQTIKTKLTNELSLYGIVKIFNEKDSEILFQFYDQFIDYKLTNNFKNLIIEQQNNFNNGKLEIKLKLNNQLSINYINILTNIIDNKNNINGIPILKRFKIDQNYEKYYENPQFFNINKSSINRIDLTFLDNLNNPIHFDENEVICDLTIRKKRK